MWDIESLKLNGVSHSPAKMPPQALYVYFFVKLTKLLKILNVSSTFPNGSLLILTWSCVVQVFGYYPLMVFLRLSFKASPNLNVYLNLCLACIFLTYPLFNHFGESRWSRYRIMMVGTVLSLVGVIISGPSMAVIFRGCLASLSTEKRCFANHSVVMVAFVGLLVYYIGVGLFEANALPFGINQLQSESKEKVQTFLFLYVWAVNFSKYGGFLVIYWMTHYGSAYWCACILLLPLFLLLFWSREYKRHFLVVEPTGQLSNPLKLVTHYAKSILSFNQHPHTEVCLSSAEDLKHFNQIFTLFVTLMGFFLAQSRTNIPFDFDDDWLMCNRFLYIFSIQLLEAVPVLSIIVLMFLGKKVLLKSKLKTKLRWGIILSLLSLILYLGCSFEFIVAYRHIRSIHPLLSVVLLSVSLFKGVANLLIVLSVLEIIFFHTGHRIQGSLYAFWQCYQAVPYFFVPFRSFARNDMNFDITLISFQTTLAVLTAMMFFFFQKKLSL